MANIIERASKRGQPEESEVDTGQDLLEASIVFLGWQGSACISRDI